MTPEAPSSVPASMPAAAPAAASSGPVWSSRARPAADSACGRGGPCPCPLHRAQPAAAVRRHPVRDIARRLHARARPHPADRAGLALRAGHAGFRISRRPGDRLGHRPLPGAGAHADESDGHAARHPRGAVGSLRHRSVRSRRPAGSFAPDRRSRPAFRPRPVCGERRLCGRHQHHRHRLPRHLLRRSSQPATARACSSSCR